MLNINPECLAERDTALRCEVATDFAAIEPLREEWDNAALKLGAPISMTFDWLKTWWEHYGDRTRLRVFLFRRGEQLTCMVPLYLETFGAGPWRTVVARIVGANLPPRCFDPPVAADCAAEVFGYIYRRLFLDDGCDLLSFGPVSHGWPASQALTSALRTGEDEVGTASCRDTDVHTVFALSAEFAKKVHSKHAAKRYLRELERRGGVRADVVTEPADLEPCFEAFARQHAEQWRGMGKGGHFVAWPRAHAFHRALVRRQGRLGRARFYRVLADGEMIACCYAYAFGTSLSWELPSRVVGPEWDKFGLGKANFIKMCQSAVAAGLLSVDAGLGDYAYKSNLGGEVAPVRITRVIPRRWSSRAKSAVFLALGRVVKLLYQKIWYRRILRRMPEWAGRSQSRFWLRFDA